MGFQPSEVTLFGVVRFNHTSGQHELIGVQTNEVVILSDGSPTVDWSVQSVAPAVVPVELFQAAWENHAILDKRGSIALNVPLITIDADPFVNNTTVTVTIEADGNQDLTVHLRALPGLEMLKLAAGTALSGAGSVSGPLRASGDPASTAGGILPAWSAINWSTTTGGVTVAAGPGTQTTMDGPASSVALALSTVAPAPFPDPVGALFDGSTMFTMSGPGGTVVSTGLTDFAIIQDSTPPTIAVNGIPSEVGVSPGAPKDIDFQIDVSDDTFFSLSDVTFTFSWVTRNGAPAVPDTIFSLGVNWELTGGAVPAGVTLTMPQPNNLSRAPIDHTGWSGVYAAAEFASAQTQWGDGTPAGNIQVQLADGRYERFTLHVDATDLAGNATPALPPTSEVLISIPTDIVVCLDYSGSMSSLPTGGGPAPAAAESKWDAAKSAANRMHAVYHAIAPAIGGVDLLDNKVGYVRFWWDDVAAADATSAVVPLTSVLTTTAGALVADPDPAWLQYTPIANGVKASVAELTGPGNTGWRRRVVIAMTDGYENRGANVIDIRTTVVADPDFIANVDEDPQNGIIIHSCAFGQDAGLDAVKMADLATDVTPLDGDKGFGGQYHSTATAATSDAAKALTNTFLDILVDSVPSVEKLIPTDAVSGSLTIDPGVDRAVILATDETAATLIGPSAGSAIEASAAGVRWWTIQTPAPGNYSLTYGVPPAVGTVDLHGVVDLQLRSRFTVEGAGVVGAELTLRACITDRGRPVSGADIRVNAVVPGQSEGELVARFAQVMKIRKRASFKIRAAVKNPDAFARRAVLVEAARKHFKLPAVNHHGAGAIVLHELANQPGCYEARFTNTSAEGSYGFAFEARGLMREQQPFERGYSVSRFLRPVADGPLTGVTWIPGRVLKGKRTWSLFVKPTTVVGYAIGGGKEFGVALAKRKEVVALRDRLDGTYSAQITLDAGQKPPALELVQGKRRVKLRPTTPAVAAQRVRVVLEGIDIGSGDKYLDDSKALMFDSVVATNSDPDRAVFRRFPSSASVKPAAGKCKDLSIVLFDGCVEEFGHLLIAVGPHGHWGAGKLTTYRRRLSGPVADWAGSYGPDDEKRDPEELRDWRLSYRVEVG